MKIQKVGVDAAPYTNEQLTIVQVQFYFISYKYYVYYEAANHM